MNYLGIDISKATFDAALLIGDKVKHQKYTNDLNGFESLLQWLKQYSDDEVRICMEATGKHWEALAKYFSDRSFFVSVCNPAQVKGFWKSELKRNKTDKLDAALIARFCRALNPVQWCEMSEQQRALRDIRRYVETLNASKVQEVNRLKSGRIDPMVRAEIEDLIRILNAKIKNLTTAMLAIIRSHQQLHEDFVLLTSIPGVGPLTAIIFLGELGSAAGFKNARALEAYCGVAPRLFNSGTSVRGKSRMSKIGSSFVRKSLYMPALSASIYNPAFTKFKNRMTEAKKPGRVIICAIMRKLIRLMFTILKSRKPFDPTHVSDHKTTKVAAC